MSCIYLNAQTQRVSNTEQFQDIGYTMSSSVFIGNYQGLNMYRASFLSNGWKMNTKKKCVRGVGPCACVVADFDETGRIHFIRAKIGDSCETGENVNGQMYYNNDGEIWIE